MTWKLYFEPGGTGFYISDGSDDQTQYTLFKGGLVTADFVSAERFPSISIELLRDLVLEAHLKNDLPF